MASSAASRVAGEMPKNLYTFLACLMAAVGLVISSFAAATNRGFELNFVFFLMVATAVVGTYLALKSTKLSLLGYVLVAYSYGALASMFVGRFTNADFFRMLVLVTSMVAVLGLVGLVFDWLEDWKAWAFGVVWVVLFGLLIVPVGTMLMLPVNGGLGPLDWIGTFVLGAWVLYNLSNGMHLPHTSGGAFDCARGMYLWYLRLISRYTG